MGEEKKVTAEAIGKIPDELVKVLPLLPWIKPIPWDPIPPFLRLNKEQIAKFYDVQNRLNVKIAEIEAEKLAELGKIAGIPL